MSKKLDELKALNEEYAAIVGEKVMGHISDPSDSNDPKRYRYAFQGDPAVCLGIDEAMVNMQDKLALARRGLVWDGYRTIEEFKAEREAMEAAHRNS
jgi:hypothetical protein